MPKPKEVNYGRDNKKVYTWFCKHFMEAVVGTVKWNKNKANLPLRKFAPPSDEAFAMIVYQNNYNKWYHQFKIRNDKWRGSGGNCTGNSEKRTVYDAQTQGIFRNKSCVKGCRKGINRGPVGGCNLLQGSITAR